MNFVEFGIIFLFVVPLALQKPLNRHQSSPPMGSVYIEVNTINFANVGCYMLGSNNATPLFDIAIIFAANINYDVEAQRAVLWFNGNVATVLEGADTYIRPLQQKGIKVLLSILGNHQGAGICNFRTPEMAKDFAGQLNDVVKLYDLDGIDFDDEFADYGNNDTPQPNPDSFLWLLKELRLLMPNKIISFYFYGPASSRLETKQLHAGDYLDYSWNAIYGTFSVPNVPKLSKAQLGPAAIWVPETDQPTAEYLAEKTVNEGYGIYLYYDLPDKNVSSYLSSVTKELYGTATSLTEHCLLTWPPPATPAFHGPRQKMRKVSLIS